MDIKNSENLAIGQGMGSGIAYINQLRADELLANLNKQDINLNNALHELQQVRDTVANLKGNEKTIHGLYAEYVEVGFNNADNLVLGKPPTHLKEPDIHSPIDYYKNGQPIQSKFINGPDIENSLTSRYGIEGHLQKYPDFLKNGGKYQVPKDQYEKTIELLSKPSSQLSRTEYTTVQKIRDFEKANNVKFKKVIEPSVVEYKDVQRGKIENTIDKEETNLRNISEDRNEQFRLKARPSLTQAAQVTAISAAIEGTLSFALSVSGKFRQGKKIGDFTEDDWKDIFKNTSIGTVRGGARGASVYALTNLAKINAPVAVALVTVTFGAVGQTIKFAKGEITQKEYIDNLQRLATETVVSGVGAAIGQAVIPIPVVGALVGSLVGSAILGSIQKVADRHLDDALFYRDIERAYYSMTEIVEDSNRTFEQALVILERQHEDFAQKRQQDIKGSDKINKLIDNI
jgi:hypothetical protein